MIGAKQLTFMSDREQKITRTMWYPRMKFNGKWCYFPDDTTHTKMVECNTEEEAWKYAAKKLLEGYE